MEAPMLTPPRLSLREQCEAFDRRADGADRRFSAPGVGLTWPSAGSPGSSGKWRSPRLREPEPSPQPSPLRPGDALWAAAEALSPLDGAEPPPATSVDVDVSALDAGAAERVQALAQAAQAALAAGDEPVLEPDCTGGTYFLRDARRRLRGVFKPADEEPYAAHNPKDYLPGSDVAASEGIKRGVAPGAAGAREVAAFLLDQASPLAAGVPATVLADVVSAGAARAKRGSLQEYVRHKCSAEDLGPSLFPAADVHAIGILDVRLVNLDRHPGNVLVAREESALAAVEAKLAEEESSTTSSSAAVAASADGPRFWGPPALDRAYSMDARAPAAQLRLVPIDNGLCLPDCDELDDVTFCWMHWPAAKLPLGRRSRAAIAQLDSWADADMLRDALGADALSDRALLWLHIGTAALQAGAQQGLTLHDIGALFVREGRGLEPAPVEAAVADTWAEVGRGADARAFMEAFEGRLPALLTPMRERALTM